jgi:chitodextrinase
VTAAAAAKPTALAVVSAVVLGALSFAGLAGGASAKRTDPVPPTAPANVHVAAVSAAAVSVAWDPSQDNVGVAGYYVWGNGGKATVSSNGYVVSGLDCGQSAYVSVSAFDRAGNRSDRSQATVATAPCPDTRAPSTPNGFVQQATTQNAVVLSWAPSTDDTGVVGYGVYRNLALVASTAQPTATLSGLSCGTTTTFQVNASDAAGNRSPFASVFVQTSACSDGQAPTTPGNLLVTSPTPTGFSLNWSASSDNVAVVGYRISLAGQPVMTVAQPGAVVSNLTCGSAFVVSVDAFDAAGNRSPAATTSTTTDACPSSPPPSPSNDTTPPSTPTALAASGISQTGLTLTWNASSDNVGVVAYDVNQGATKVATVSSTSSTLGALACGTPYTFSVVARDAAGNASQPAQLTVSTTPCSSPPPPPPPPSDTAAPSQPTNLAISGSTRTGVTLTWSPSTDNVGVTAYRAYVNGSASTTVTQPGAGVSGLTCGTGYTFEVDATDAAGNRSSRASLVGSTAACADTQAPSTPANVVASSRTATSIALTWSASTDNVGVTAYGLYRGGSAAGSTTTTTGIFSGLSCNTSYTLAVDAADAAGNRSSQAIVMVSTTSCPDTSPPSTPTGLAASSVTQSSMNLSWNAASDNVGVTGYDVSRNGTKVATVSGTTSSQTGLACGTSYSFDVVALDAAGNRSQQAQLTVSTSACASAPPPAPSSSPAYFDADYQNGSFGAPWTTLFSYANPGWVDLTSSSASTTSDGRVKVVPAPGSSGNAARFEIRDSDPGWAGTTLQKSEIRTVTQQTFDKSSVSPGDVRWFSTRLYLPYTSTEKFEWAHGGSNPFTCLLDLHPGSSSMWPAFSLQWYPSSSQQWATLRVAGGDFSNPGQNMEEINLWQLADAAGTRVMSNYNRWIDLVWGMRFASDSTGWLEVWVDGVNVYPRKNRPTMWSGDTGEYLKQGLYKQKDATFPESGRSVLYYGRTTVGLTKP